MADTSLIKGIVITERSVVMNESGKYVFNVAISATKNEIKKAIKAMYQVDVDSVNTVTTPGKPKRYRNTIQLRPAHKKAIVTLKEGHKIDIGR
jgi:large subunit ribosomal protein L23